MFYSLIPSKCIKDHWQHYWLLYKNSANNGQRALYSKEAHTGYNRNVKSLNRHIVCQIHLSECLVFWASRNSPF